MTGLAVQQFNPESTNSIWVRKKMTSWKRTSSEIGQSATEPAMPERSRPPKPSLRLDLIVAITGIERKVKGLLKGCPTIPGWILLDSDIEKATKFMLVGAAEAFEARVEYYASQSGFCREWLDEAADETVAATLEVPGFQFWKHSSYLARVPSIAKELRKILGPRIDEWMNRIDQIQKQQPGVLAVGEPRRPGFVDSMTQFNRDYWRNLLSDFEKLQGHRFILIWSPRPLKCEGEPLEDHHCVWTEFPDPSLKARLSALALRGARALGYESEEDWYDQLAMSDFVRFEMTESTTAERADGEMVETKWCVMDVVKESITLCYKLDAGIRSLGRLGMGTPSQTDESPKNKAFESDAAVEVGAEAHIIRIEQPAVLTRQNPKFPSPATSDGAASRDEPSPALGVRDEKDGTMFEGLNASAIARFRARNSQEAYQDAYDEFAPACDNAFNIELPPGKHYSHLGIRAAASKLSKQLAGLAEKYFEKFAVGVGEQVEQEYEPTSAAVWCNAVIQVWTRRLWRDVDEVWSTWLNHIRKMTEGTVFGARPYPIGDPELAILKDHQERMKLVLWSIAARHSIPKEEVREILSVDEVRREPLGAPAAKNEAGVLSEEFRINAAVPASGNDVANPEEAGNAAISLRRDVTIQPGQAEPGTGASQPITASPARMARKRGRPAEIETASKEAALAVRARNGNWREAAKVLYKTPRPTHQQVKNAANVLKHYQKSVAPLPNKS